MFREGGKQGGRAGAPTGRKAAGGTREARGALLGSRGTHSSELLQVLVLFLARGQPLQGSKENAAWESELSSNSSTPIPGPLVFSTQLEASRTKISGDWLALVKLCGKRG